MLLAQAIPLHQLATKYRVASLQRGVADYMRAHLAGGAGPAVGWYHYAVSTGDEALRQSCLQFLAWNLSAVAGSAEWGAVSPELLAQLLPRSDLVLQDELELFQALEAWLGRARPPPAVAERALRAIRYPMIPAAQLFQLQARSAALARHGPAVADLLLQAYQFHAASPLHYAKFFDVNGAPSCPTTTSRLPAAPRGSSTTRPATIAAPASRRSWAQAATTRAAGSPGTCSSRHAGCR